ncbi:MAG: hypothetical protein QOE06_2386 [Thermoleophilaceae bacterium]|nr:hypothetical protein [Thermoleophilaceae bacterium]
MIEPRIYRAAFLPALLGLVVAMFSLESPPRPLQQAAPADVLFEGSAAANTVRSIVQRTPDRRTGSPGEQAVAARVTSAFRHFGLQTSIDRFKDGNTSLTNVMARRPGVSRHQVVVIAARDALSVPDATGSAADTAALMEFGRVLQGRATQKTVVLASVGGGTGGEAGARRLAQHLGSIGPVDAVIVLSNMGAPHSHGPLLVDWSNNATRGNLGLRRTAANALRNEVGEDGGPAGSAPAQIARLAFPVGLGAQGVLIEDGVTAIRVSASGELAAPRGERQVSDVHPVRYEEFGRAALRLLFTLDEQPRPPDHGPRSYVTVGGRLAPGWALSLLAITLILPVLVASIDALARARRRGAPVLPWLAWVAAGTVPFLAGLALAELLVLVGIATDAPAAPLDPSAAPVDASAVGVVVAVVLTIALVWILMRTSLLRRGRRLPDPTEPGAGVAITLVLCGLTLASWAINPFTGLALVLPLHLWMLAVLTGVRARTRIWMTLAGLLPAAAIVATYAQQFRMGPVEGGWYLFFLVTGHQVGLVSALLGCVALGVLGSVAAVALAHARRGDPDVPHVPGSGGRPPVDRRSVSGPAGPPLERVRR